MLLMKINGKGVLRTLPRYIAIEGAKKVFESIKYTLGYAAMMVLQINYKKQKRG